jgi:hypothetical protein
LLDRVVRKGHDHGVDPFDHASRPPFVGVRRGDDAFGRGREDLHDRRVFLDDDGSGVRGLVGVCEIAGFSIVLTLFSAIAGSVPIRSTSDMWPTTIRSQADRSTTVWQRWQRSM